MTISEIPPSDDSTPPLPGPLPHRRRRLGLNDYAAGLRAQNRVILGRAITLMESSRDDDQDMARDLLRLIAPDTGKALRIGLSGVPGAGKSTLLETLGCRLTAAGRRLAVLAVDPSSQVSGGSILGDKTRMPKLAAEPNAFIRPSPNSTALGGVARKTRETILLCEAAGFDVIMVETVGVGQSETAVAEMTDCFVVLTLPGAGDELQGIKRGILELADVLAVTKCDGTNIPRARLAATQLQHALHLLHPPDRPWQPPVLTCSAFDGSGVDELWSAIQKHQDWLTQSGQRLSHRSEQDERWMWTLVQEGFRRALAQDPRITPVRNRVLPEVRTGALAPDAAARALLAAFGIDAYE